MQKFGLFKKLLPGFIPLFIFIAADEIWGTRIGLCVAVGFGVAELVYIAIREKRFDGFILFDTLLLVALGGVSILLENDLFFKLKPGLIELILVAVLGVSAFSKLNIIGLMGKRYLKDIQINEVQAQQMARSLRVMFYIFLLHTLLVFYSAFYLSKGAWAFISGGLFYILFGIYFLFEFGRQRYFRKKTEDVEWLPVVDEQGKILGKVPRPDAHKGQKILHPVVHLHVLGPNKTLMLQKRPMSKPIQPGKWDSSVGGHIAFGESLETALRREAEEEIGLKDFSAKLLKVYRWDTEVESELVYMFVTRNYKGINILNPEEVEEIRFWTFNEIEKNICKEVFTPNLELEYSYLKTLSVI